MEGTVDLHGLFIKEALEYAKQEFQSAVLRTDRVVRFIVGTSLDGLFDECRSQRGGFFFMVVSLPFQERGCTRKPVRRKFGRLWNNCVMST